MSRRSYRSRVAVEYVESDEEHSDSSSDEEDSNEEAASDEEPEEYGNSDKELATEEEDSEEEQAMDEEDSDKQPVESGEGDSGEETSDEKDSSEDGEDSNEEATSEEEPDEYENSNEEHASEDENSNGEQAMDEEDSDKESVESAGGGEKDSSADEEDSNEEAASDEEPEEYANSDEELATDEENSNEETVDEKDSDEAEESVEEDSESDEEDSDTAGVDIQAKVKKFGPSSRGLAIIISVDEDGAILAKDDNKALSQVFKEFGFIVCPYHNITKSKLETIITATASSNHPMKSRSAYCIVFAFSGHGGQNASGTYLWCTDDGIYLEEYILKSLLSGPRIKKLKIPVIFFVDSCRTVGNSDSEEESTDEEEPYSLMGKPCARHQFWENRDKTDGDFIIGYATSPHQVAYSPVKMPLGGYSTTSYSMELCKYLRKHAHKPIQEILALVKEAVAERQLPQQKPEVYDRLKHPLYLKKKVITDIQQICQKLPELIDLLREFVDSYSSTYDSVDEAINSADKTEIRYEKTFRYAREDLKDMKDKVLKFVDKFDDFCWRGQMQSDLNAMYKASRRNDFQKLKSVVDQLKTYLAEAEQLYIEFIESSKRAEDSCIRAADTCENKARKAKQAKEMTVQTGRTVVAGVVQPFTIVAEVLTATVTCCVASNFEESARTFRTLGIQFTSLNREVLTMRNQASEIHDVLEEVGLHVDEFERSENTPDMREDINRSLAEMSREFCSSYEKSSSYLQIVQGKRSVDY